MQWRTSPSSDRELLLIELLTPPAECKKTCVKKYVSDGLTPPVD